MVAPMRVVVSAVLIVWLSLCGDAFAGCPCSFGKNDADARAGRFYCLFDEDQATLPASSVPYSSFRGLSLASSPEDMQRIGNALGYGVDTSLFVGDNAVSSISLYRDCQLAGQAQFDRHGRMLRLALKDRFFCDRAIFVRRLAEALFDRYGVTPVTVADDICFQDVTCFKGVFKHGEQFLILRIGTEADIYVRP
jgi:hypothetical protein